MRRWYEQVSVSGTGMVFRRLFLLLVVGWELFMTNAVAIALENKQKPSACSSVKPVKVGLSKPVLISDAYLFLEGPTWSEHMGVFYFSEMDFAGAWTHGPKARIYQLALPDNISVVQPDSGSNGLLAHNNWLYVMNHKKQALSRLSLVNTGAGKVEQSNSEQANEEMQVLANHYAGKRFLSPNDLVRHSAGYFYFTDPNWQLGDRAPEMPFTGVFKVDKQGIVTLVDDSLKNPNGVALSPDEKTLYVGDANNQISRYTLNKKGNIAGKKQHFASLPSPDGMAVDCRGNLYVASHTAGKIVVYSPEGQTLTALDLGVKTTNVAFGGTDMKTLLITTANGLFVTRSTLPGLYVNTHK